MMDRQGVEVDYCPDCRGIWLDRGELEKLIELSIARRPVARSSPYQEYESHRREYDREDHHDDERRRRKRRSRGSWLSELLDFD